ncbi:DUF2690 domain-containing protein [Streptomyces sp. NPDC101490]|uniref:DUF2690 domain-containing protein n=1 Tax=Streptomyces sp. NPDC101490 TaxID=3366143 RepID=UPI0037F9ACA4
MRVSPALQRAAAVVVAGTALLAGLSGSAQANPGHDLRHPIDSGCAADAITARSAALYADGARIGTIQLRYSPSCRSVWTRVYSDGPRVDGSTHRNETSTYSGHCYGTLWDSALGQYYCYTPMLDDAGYTSFGEGIASNRANTRTSVWGVTGSY